MGCIWRHTYIPGLMCLDLHAHTPWQTMSTFLFEESGSNCHHVPSLFPPPPCTTPHLPPHLPTPHPPPPHSPVSGHGVPQQLISSSLQALQSFFALPAPTKAALQHNLHAKGYMSWGQQTLDLGVQTCGDTKETWAVMGEAGGGMWWGFVEWEGELVPQWHWQYSRCQVSVAGICAAGGGGFWGGARGASQPDCLLHSCSDRTPPEYNVYNNPDIMPWRYG